MTGTTTKRVFKPLEWQIPAWRDKSLVLLLDGPAGTGKSHLAAHKIDALLRKYKRATGLMVRKTRESMTNSTLLFMAREVIGDDPNVEWKRQDRRFEYANGSVLAYGGMKDDFQRESIRSIGLSGGLDFVWMEEGHLFHLMDFEELISRMRGNAAPFRQIILTTNPDSDQHWIYKRLIQGGGASRYIARTEDNTYNPADYADTVLEQLSGVRYQRLRLGKWVGAEGAVYSDYSYETHVVEPFAIPADWQRFRSIDFGYTNPFVCQWWAVDGDGRMYLYRELYETGALVSDMAEEINRLSAGERISFTVADHDAEDRATLARHNIYTLPAKKDIRTGVQAVQDRIRIAGDGRPRLLFFNDALVRADQTLIDKKKPTCAVDEITGYVWEKDQSGRPAKEHPVKLDDHAMDAMRYAVMALEQQHGQVRVSKRNPFFN